MLLIIKETMTGIQKTEQGCPNLGVSEGVGISRGAGYDLYQFLCLKSLGFTQSTPFCQY